jgi:hypothetical protein
MFVLPLTSLAQTAILPVMEITPLRNQSATSVRILPDTWANIETLTGRTFAHVPTTGVILQKEDRAHIAAIWRHILKQTPGVSISIAQAVRVALSAWAQSGDGAYFVSLGELVRVALARYAKQVTEPEAQTDHEQGEYLATPAVP